MSEKVSGIAALYNFFAYTTYYFIEADNTDSRHRKSEGVATGEIVNRER